MSQRGRIIWWPTDGITDSPSGPANSTDILKDCHDCTFAFSVSPKTLTLRTVMRSLERFMYSGGGVRHFMESSGPCRNVLYAVVTDLQNFIFYNKVLQFHKRRKHSKNALCRSPKPHRIYYCEGKPQRWLRRERNGSGNKTSQNRTDVFLGVQRRALITVGRMTLLGKINKRKIRCRQWV